MKNAVIIKSFQNGISVKLDPNLPFQDIYLEVARKFRESEKFFKNAKMVISFEGRKLNSEEETLLVGAITDHSSLQVLCIIGNDEEKNQSFIHATRQLVNNENNADGQYYKGTLRAGQVLETDSSIIILGDVNPGANVISTGNIVVLGTLYGHAYAGANGNDQTFVVALDMQSSKIRIGDHTETAGEKGNKWLKSRSIPKIAYVKDGEICSDAITKELLNDLRL